MAMRKISASSNENKMSHAAEVAAGSRLRVELRLSS